MTAVPAGLAAEEPTQDAGGRAAQQLPHGTFHDLRGSADPDRLANLAIIPLQLRMVYQIGQAHGQQMDANQVRDLAGALGIGAAAQVMEGAVRKLLGGAASSILGGLLGGTAGLAAGAAVTFASTYALGHVAKQYYAQGRRLSTADLKALFARFQEEAKTLYPKVQSQVQAQSRSLNIQQLLSGLRG